MFKYRVYGRVDGASRPALLCATDYADVAQYVRDNIGAAFGVDDEKRLAISITESNTEFFSRLQKAGTTEAGDADADS